MKTMFILIILILLTITTKSQFIEANKHRLDSVFDLKNIEITKSSTSGTCIALPLENKIELSSKLLSDLSKGYGISSENFLEEGILSHEYGHIKQYQNGMEMKGDEKFMIRELHCDLMAGFYLSNYFRYEFLNNDISDQSIINRVCSFFSSRDRNPNLYLIVSMLINSIYDYKYDSLLFKGNDDETVKLLRFTVFWQGIRLSEKQSINNVYNDGLNYIENLISNKEANRTFVTFQVIGLETINNILHGKLNCKSTVKAIGKRVSQSNLISDKEKLLYAGVILSIISCCP